MPSVWFTSCHKYAINYLFFKVKNAVLCILFSSTCMLSFFSLGFSFHELRKCLLIILKALLRHICSVRLKLSQFYTIWYWICILGPCRFQQVDEGVSLWAHTESHWDVHNHWGGNQGMCQHFDVQGEDTFLGINRCSSNLMFKVR